MVTNRCSPSDDSSSLVSAKGSKSATSASENRTPCLMKLILALAGSQTTFIYVLCAYWNRCQQPALFLVSAAERMVHLRARTIRTCLKTYIIQRPSGATTGSPVFICFSNVFSNLCSNSGAVRSLSVRDCRC